MIGLNSKSVRIQNLMVLYIVPGFYQTTLKCPSWEVNKRNESDTFDPSQRVACGQSDEQRVSLLQCLGRVANQVAEGVVCQPRRHAAKLQSSFCQSSRLSTATENPKKKRQGRSVKSNSTR